MILVEMNQYFSLNPLMREMIQSKHDVLFFIQFEKYCFLLKIDENEVASCCANEFIFMANFGSLTS